MNPIELGKFIAILRSEKKLTQEDLADKLYIDKRKISRWECGTSIPDFEMLIKLSEILDVSLYELSICKRLDKEKLSRRALNKFKSIKDFKRYKLRKKIKIILAIILGIFFIFTAIYTIKFYGTVEIYEFNSLDEQYTIEGTYIRANDYSIYNINKIYYSSHNENISNIPDNCEIEIIQDENRKLYITNTNQDSSDSTYINTLKENNYSKIISNKSIDKPLSLKISCYNNEKNKNHTIKFELVKKYDNKLF